MQANQINRNIRVAVLYLTVFKDHNWMIDSVEVWDLLRLHWFNEKLHDFLNARRGKLQPREKPANKELICFYLFLLSLVTKCVFPHLCDNKIILKSSTLIKMVQVLWELVSVSNKTSQITNQTC